ncbi:MAG TPA: phage Gp37/Gp68 family protein [Phycisphaerales bacterium]|nr:phage Gp37/Gp68 family protein [Phycisphaerales bacterium]
MNKSKIEWTESTWNPVSGCSKISAGCLHCYAERMAKRLRAMGQKRYRNGFEVTLHPEALDDPYSWKKGRVVFVNSMSDLFHEDIDVDFIKQVFSVMNANQRHTFQVLTKRSDRLSEIAPLLEWSDNIWMGVTIENNDYVHRADDLRKVDAAVRFLSLEPLLGALPDLDLSGIDWAIVGGESGPGARPIEAEWVREIREQCIGQDVEFFFKQWGGINKKKNGRLLDGKTWNGMPELNRELCLT